VGGREDERVGADGVAGSAVDEDFARVDVGEALILQGIAESDSGLWGFLSSRQLFVPVVVEFERLTAMLFASCRFCNAPWTCSAPWE
jgi:hypothetical protein